MTEAPVVELRDVFCVHRSSGGDAAALQGASLALESGEMLCIIGPSGAGKSTLLRTIAGLQIPSAGSVLVHGVDVGRAPARVRARIRHERQGFLSQSASDSLPPDIPLRDAVALPLRLRGIGKRARHRRVTALLDAADLLDRADALPAEISGGERQRAALCTALAHRPSLLLADEPTGELDRDSAATMRTLIRELAAEQGTSAIVVSHDPAMSAIGDRTLAIRDGRVAEDFSTQEAALVVSPDGWLRLPRHLLRHTGISGRARVRLEGDGLLIRRVGKPERSADEPSSPRRPDATPMSVRLNRVARAYGTLPVLSDFSHDFPAGSFTALSGRSGSGKTTLLRLAAGLDRPDHGDVLVGEANLALATETERAGWRRRCIGYLPQAPAMIGFLSALENIALALRIRGWDTAAAAADAHEALAQVGLRERSSQRVERLSAGEVQRAALARALSGSRGLLIVDEPTSRLDEANAAAVASLLRAAAQAGHTVLCATHDPAVIAGADTVVELEAMNRISRGG